MVPTFEQVLAYSGRFVCEEAKPNFEAGLRKLYKP